MDWPTLLKDYQSGLVGLLGFTGVIVTLIVNAKLARRQHERKLADERAILRGALLAELTILRNVYQDRIEKVADRPGPGSGIIVPVHVISEVYNRLMDKLGLLTSDEAGKVISAYLLARELPENVRLVKWSKQLPADQDTEHFILVPPPAIETVLKMHRVQLGEIEKAIDALTNATRQ